MERTYGNDHITQSTYLILLRKFLFSIIHSFIISYTVLLAGSVVVADFGINESALWLVLSEE